jgi:hypothetical protein
MTPLWESTRELHHACEKHPVGAAMASGSPPPLYYVDWLGALEEIHTIVDPDMGDVLRRTDRLRADTRSMGLEPLKLNATKEYVEKLKQDSLLRAGAAYVLTGAHLMGGEIMRRRLVDFPTEHLTWDDRPAALLELKSLREADNVVEPAIACFKALLDIMDEIQEKRGAL